MRKRSIDASIATSIPTWQASQSRSPSIYVKEMEKRIEGNLAGWTDRFRKVLSREWFRTTILVWGVWLCISLGGYWGDMR